MSSIWRAWQGWMLPYSGLGRSKLSTVTSWARKCCSHMMRRSEHWPHMLQRKYVLYMSLFNVGVLTCVIRLDATLRVRVRWDIQDASRSGKCHQSSSVVRPSECLNLATVFRVWKRRGDVSRLPRAGPDLFLHHTANQVSWRVLVVIGIGSLTRYTDWDACY